MKKKIKKKTYTESEHYNRLEEELKFQTQKHYTIINYILNKNSHPLPRGMDYEKIVDEIQDYENYLATYL